VHAVAVVVDRRVLALRVVVGEDGLDRGQLVAPDAPRAHLVGTGDEIFGSGGGDELAAAIDAPLLGRIPLDPRLREQADVGEPLVWAEPENETARAIYEAAEAIVEAGREPGTIKKPLPLAT